MAAVDNIIRVYDQNMNKIAYLENAYMPGYDLRLNELGNPGLLCPRMTPKTSTVNLLIMWRFLIRGNG